MGVDADVVVVGAGLAGLAAAREVAAAGHSVVVLEARERVGGRTVSQDVGGVRLDMGGQWVGPTQDAVLALIAELGLTLSPSYEEGDHLLGMDGKVTRYQGPGFGLPDPAAEEVLRLQELLEEMALRVPLEAPGEAPEADAWESRSVGDWLASNSTNGEALRFWQLIVPAVFACEIGELTLLHFLTYVKSGGMLDMLVSTGGGAQDSRVVEGTQRISELLAAALGPAVRLGHEVDAIEQDAHGVTVRGTLNTPGSEERFAVRAARAIVAVPPLLAGRLRYRPPLPADRDRLTQLVPAGSVVKVQAVYPTPFWRDQNLSGFVLSTDDLVSVVFDNTPEPGPEGTAPGVLLGFMEGEHAVQAARLSPEERRSNVLGTFARFLGTPAASPLAFAELDWSAEEFTRGCYGGRLGAGAWTRFGAALREPVGRLHWAGSETAEIWMGYMDGALRSGRRAATEVLAQLGPATGTQDPAAA